MIRHPLGRAVHVDLLKAELAARLGRGVELVMREPTEDDPVGVLILEDPDTGERLDVDPAAVAGALAAHQLPKGRRQLLLEEFDAAPPAGKLLVLRKFLAQEAQAEVGGSRAMREFVNKAIEDRVQARREGRA